MTTHEVRAYKTRVVHRCVRRDIAFVSLLRRLSLEGDVRNRAAQYINRLKRSRRVVPARMVRRPLVHFFIFVLIIEQGVNLQLFGHIIAPILD